MHLWTYEDALGQTQHIYVLWVYVAVLLYSRTAFFSHKIQSDIYVSVHCVFSPFKIWSAPIITKSNKGKTKNNHTKRACHLPTPNSHQPRNILWACNKHTCVTEVGQDQNKSLKISFGQYGTKSQYNQSEQSDFFLLVIFLPRTNNCCAHGTQTSHLLKSAGNFSSS